jgi:hypothetical protein
MVSQREIFEKKKNNNNKMKKIKADQVFLCTQSLRVLSPTYPREGIRQMGYTTFSFISKAI